MSVGNEREDKWKELTQKNTVVGAEATWDKYESCDKTLRECSTSPTNLHITQSSSKTNLYQGRIKLFGIA